MLDFANALFSPGVKRTSVTINACNIALGFLDDASV